MKRTGEVYKAETAERNASAATQGATRTNTISSIVLHVAAGICASKTFTLVILYAQWWGNQSNRGLDLNQGDPGFGQITGHAIQQTAPYPVCVAIHVLNNVVSGRTLPRSVLRDLP